MGSCRRGIVDLALSDSTLVSDALGHTGGRHGRRREAEDIGC